MSIIISDDCFKNIIGLSRNNSECFEVPDDALTSKSGFYIDEVEGLNLKIIDAVDDNSGGDIFDILSWSRDEAIRIFKTDMIREIGMRAVLDQAAFSGFIGETDATKTRNINKAMAGERQIMKPVRGGVMRVKRIGLYFEGAETFTLGLYRKNESTAMFTQVVTSEANKLKWITPSSELNLPMFDKGKSSVVYDWIYLVDSDNMPKDTQLHCGCASVPRWTYPQLNFDKVSKSIYDWSQWSMVSGFSGNDIDEREGWVTGVETNGLIFDVEFICNVYDTLCNSELDIIGDPMAMESARIIRCKAVELVIGKILTSPDIDPYTSQHGEVLASIAGTNLADYKNSVTEQAIFRTQPEMLNLYSDCYSCKNGFGFKKSGIMS